MIYLAHHLKVLKYIFFLGYVITAGADANNEADIRGNRKYFLPRGKIQNYVMLDERNFDDHSINDLIKQYDESRKVSTGQSNVY